MLARHLLLEKTNMKTQIDTRPYETAHGKRPSGRGSWAFCSADKWNAPNYLDHVIWIPGCKTYGEAKREAIQKLTAMGITTAVACS
jgi:hypothetical protein